MRAGRDRLAKNGEMAETDAVGSGGAVLIVGKSLSLPTRADFQVSLQPLRRV